MSKASVSDIAETMGCEKDVFLTFQNPYTKPRSEVSEGLGFQKGIYLTFWNLYIANLGLRSGRLGCQKEVFWTFRNSYRNPWSEVWEAGMSKRNVFDILEFL